MATCHKVLLPEEDCCISDDRSIVSAVKGHPWVKYKVDGPMTIYTLNLKAFNKWLKTDEGRKYGKRGCGDDAIYTVSEFLRLYMPRGMAVYDDGTDFFVIRGFLKFTGISSGDEDEQSSVTDNTAGFFKNGKTLANCTRFTVTNKSNGENGKWAIRRCKDGSYIIFAGSKNAMKYWKPGEAIPKSETSSEGYIPCDEIVKWIHNYCEGVSEEFMKHIADNEWTLMFEINHPDSEHVFPIHEMRMDFVSILGSDGHPIGCHIAFEFFSDYSLPHVAYSEHSSDELQKVIEDTRMRTDTEGIVIYLFDDNECFGLIKIKTNYYVIARAIRECFKHFIHPALAGNLTDGPITGKPNPKKPISTMDTFSDVEKRIRKRMRNMTHLSNYKERFSDWIDNGITFLSFWKSNYLSKKTDEEKVEYLHYSKKKYGTLYHQAMNNYQEVVVSELVDEMIESLIIS